MNDVPIRDLVQLEGTHRFECEQCKEIFDTVMDWAKHAVTDHADLDYGVMPIAKQ